MSRRLLGIVSAGGTSTHNVSMQVSNIHRPSLVSFTILLRDCLRQCTRTRGCYEQTDLIGSFFVVSIDIDSPPLRLRSDRGWGGGGVTWDPGLVLYQNLDSCDSKRLHII